jgi:ribosomal protein S18 acetylase RimI-like enzyme
MEELIIREATGEDLEQAAELIVRMKRLNGEFDPIFKVVGDVKQKALDYLRASMDAKDQVVLVAARGPKVVGVLRAEIRQRLFYEPVKEGNISDFYILPEARRKALGNDFLIEAIKRLKRIGAEMIVAEFPAQNEIAVRFYAKRGFRALVNVYAREDEAMQD